MLISPVALVADCGARNDVARGVCEGETARSFRAGARNARRWRCSSVAPVHISASDIDLLFETAEVAAGQLPAASLAAVYAGGTACPDDTRSAVVATPATRGRRRAAAAAAVVAQGIPRRHRPPLDGGGVGRRLRVGPPRVCPRPPPTCLRRRWSDGRGPPSPAVAEVGGRPPWGKRGGVWGGDDVWGWTRRILTRRARGGPCAVATVPRGKGRVGHRRASGGGDAKTMPPAPLAPLTPRAGTGAVLRAAPAFPPASAAVAAAAASTRSRALLWLLERAAISSAAGQQRLPPFAPPSAAPHPSLAGLCAAWGSFISHFSLWCFNIYAAHEHCVTMTCTGEPVGLSGGAASSERRRHRLTATA